MAEFHNMWEALWSNYGPGPAAVVTSLDGAAPMDWLAVIALTCPSRSFFLDVRFVREGVSPPLANCPVIVLGAPDSLGPDIAKLSAKARFPSRFDIASADGRTMVRDLQQTSDDRYVDSDDAAYVHLFRGHDHDVGRRATIIVEATDAWGAIGGAVWMTQRDLENLPAPDTFPADPIEAVVRVARCAEEVPGPGQLTTERIAAGSMEFDFNAWLWRAPIRRTQVRVIGVDGKPESIHVGSEKKKLDGTDLPGVLLELARATYDGRWISVAEILRRLKKGTEPRRVRTIENRLRDVRRLSPDLGFLETQTIDGVNHYRLCTDITFEGCGIADR
ncbi:MAG TPA: hypothetical protein VKT77_11550 [Chthonomonadaceae bacterium]|nr:hypothetical protein [Chthonomonadaceae bacterium]